MTSQSSRARVVGVVSLLMSVVGAPTLLYLPRFISPMDPGATAQRIAANSATYQWLTFGDLVAAILFAVLGWLFYQLFEDTDRGLARLLLVLVTISATFGMIDAGLLSVPTVLHARAAAFGAFSPAQLDALSFAVLRVRAGLLNANEMLWGLWLVPLGILSLESGFIHKIVGVLVLIASVGYVADSTAYFVAPAYAAAVGGIAMILFQGELAIIFWLLIAGARPQRVRD